MLASSSMGTPATTSTHLAEAGSDSQRRHIPELDGIRGIAALMVLFHHLFFTSIPHPERWNRLVDAIATLSHAGGYGVDLFFVLSGYLITSLLLLDRKSPNYYWNFYWKRALRILPLYFMALAVLLVFSPSSGKYVGLAIVFLANFAQVFHVASAGPFWTLAIEEQFYLVWPRFVRQLSPRGLEWLALSFAITCPVLRIVAALFHHSNYMFTFFHCDGLALGALLACRQARLPSVARGVRFAGGLYSMLSALLLLALPFAFEAGSMDAEFAGALQLSGVSLLAYSVVAVAVRSTGSRSLKVLRSSVLTFFGLISYCLYVSNSYVVVLYDRTFGPLQEGNMQQYLLRALAVFAITIAICVASRYALELPAMSLRRRVLRPYSIS